MCSCDQSLVTVAFLWEKLSQRQFYKDLTRKGYSWFKFNNLELALGSNLKFYTSMAKGLKVKVRKIWGLIPLFVENTGEKLVGGPLCLPPILNRVKKCQIFQTKNKLKELILAKYHAFHKYHTSFDLLGGLKLQYQWKSINLLRGFFVSVQCSRSNSKNLWRNSLKSSVQLRKWPLSKTMPAILQKMRGEEFSVFSTSFKGEKM